MPVILVLLLSLTAAAACGQSKPADKVAATKLTGQELWNDKKPTDYEFTLQASGMIGRFATRITVKDGRVASSTAAPGSKAVPFGLQVGTIDDVFAQLDKDRQQADKVSVTYDPVWGFPLQVDVDEITNAIDDEHGYGISDFAETS